TSLRLMLRQSKAMIDLAKDQPRKSAVGLSHFSRNGVKTGYALHWELDGEWPAHLLLQEVQDGFRSAEAVRRDENGDRPPASLPGRLPYKLREFGPLLEALLSDETLETNDKNQLMDGFFRQALKGDIDNRLADSAFRVWSQGLSLARKQGWPLERAVDGLLLARRLASGGEEDG
ncbi:MAG TPA: hypothetical protein VLV83_14355, partial [Acidobacteriota bacterium]|nr:hypothetical protein [Acidobacteriota bacterium]